MADENLIVLSDQDRVLLSAVRRYIQIMDYSHADMVEELFELASQSVLHLTEEYTSELTSSPGI